MIRVQVLSSFLAASVCFALLAPGLTSPSEPGWDSRESKSDLFDRQASPSDSRAVYASTLRTVSKWEGMKVFRAVSKSRSIVGQPTGAMLSLVSFSPESHPAALTDCQDGPDNNQPPVFSSVQKPTGTTMTCSTAAGNYVYGDTCSVNSATSQYDPTCSTVAAVKGSGNQGYCSTNVGKGPGPQYCSASGAGTLSGQPSCSAGPGTGPNGTAPICSTQNNPQQMDGNNTTYYCSVGLNNVPTTNAQCSTGTYSGAAGKSGQCSAQTGPIGGGTQTNSCSVISDGKPGLPNYCSTDGSDNNSCSAFGTPGNGTTSDFCSVTSSTFTNAMCTVLIPASGTGACSVLGGGTGGNCSVKLAGGGVRGPNGFNQCGSIAP